MQKTLPSTDDGTFQRRAINRACPRCFQRSSHLPATATPTCICESSPKFLHQVHYAALAMSATLSGALILVSVFPQPLIVLAEAARIIAQRQKICDLRLTGVKGRYPSLLCQLLCQPQVSPFLDRPTLCNLPRESAAAEPATAVPCVTGFTRCCSACAPKHMASCGVCCRALRCGRLLQLNSASKLLQQQEHLPAELQQKHHCLAAARKTVAAIISQMHACTHCAALRRSHQHPEIKHCCNASEIPAAAAALRAAR